MIANSQACLLGRFRKTLKQKTKSLRFGIKIGPLIMAALNLKNTKLQLKTDKR